jgi:opacity protein-like surface antigen
MFKQAIERKIGKGAVAMKKSLVISVAMLLLLISPTTFCFAGEIKKGTSSLGASSNAVFESVDDEDGQDSRLFNVSAEFGYFFIDNFEIGSALTLGYVEGDETESWSYSITPFIMYHFVFNEASNIYIGAGAGFGRCEIDHLDSDKDVLNFTEFFAEAGWEYFFTSNIALNLGLRAEKEDIDSDFSDSKFNSYGSYLRLKFFF